MNAFTLRLDDELNEQLELLVFVQRTSKTEIIRQAILEYLDKNPTPEDPRK